MIVALFGSTVFLLPMFDISTIEINGLTNVTEEEIRAALPGSEGSNIMLFNTIKAERELSKNHYIEHISVRRALPSTVVVNVQEYKLRAYVPYMGNYLYITDNGRVIDVQSSFTKQLPVLVGLKFDHFSIGEILDVDNPEAFDAMVELSKLFEKYSILSDIVKVDVSDVSDIHLYVGKIDTQFGSFDNANRKILTLIEVLKQLDTSVAGKLNLTGDNASFEYLT